jgi:hypothetical protein
MPRNSRIAPMGTALLKYLIIGVKEISRKI